MSNQPQTTSVKRQKTAKKDFISSLGRRKTATARVRLYLKPGPILVNDTPVEHYFPGEINQTRYLSPLRLTSTADKFSATIKVSGSGKTGQLEAIVHGLSRALSKYDRDSYHQPLKAAGFLTRDSRAKERRKVGTGGKARRQKQSPKR